VDRGETRACILQVNAEHAVITCEFSMAAFATGERRKRGKVRVPVLCLHPRLALFAHFYVWTARSPLHTSACAQGDRRSAELATMLRQTLESAILVELYPRTQIHVFVQVR
jgi:exosome complex component RRP41